MVYVINFLEYFSIAFNFFWNFDLGIWWIRLGFCEYVVEGCYAFCKFCSMHVFL